MGERQQCCFTSRNDKQCGISRSSAAEVEHGLRSAVPNVRMAALVKQYGVDFELTHVVEAKLQSAGASNDLILHWRRNDWLESLRRNL